jgi:hypothetical protein
MNETLNGCSFRVIFVHSNQVTSEMRGSEGPNSAVGREQPEFEYAREWIFEPSLGNEDIEHVRESSRSSLGR